MDRTIAINKLQLLALTCSTCNKEQPTYRMLIVKDVNKFKNQQESIQQSTKLSMRNASSSQAENGLQMSNRNRVNNIAENVQQTDESEHTKVRKYSQVEQKSLQDKIKANKQQNLIFICFQCFKDKKMSFQQVHNETYFDLGCRYIKDIPLPDYDVAEQCLAQLKEIQQKSSQIIKHISQKIDQFKFYILKLAKETSNFCSSYIKKIKFFEELRINERFLLENEIKNLQTSQPALQKQKLRKKLKKKLKQQFFVNQNQGIINLHNKQYELTNIKNKIEQIKIVFPSFSEEIITTKRKKIPICDIPISSMINFKGKSYFGAADGRIIYQSKKSFVSHKGHDSLIRSFSHDNQYTLYSGSDDFSIKAWGIHGDEIQHLKTFGILPSNKSYHRNICVIDSGNSLISTRGQFDNFHIRVWSLKNQFENIGCLKGHDSFIRAMVLIDKQKDIIMTGSDDRKINIWDAKKHKLLKTIHRNKKINNIIASQKHKLCAIIDEENKVSIMDLIQYNMIMAWVLPRKISCSCGYSKNYANTRQIDSDYLLICIPTNIGIWTWNGSKIWSMDTEVTFTPIFLMQVSNKIVVSDGTGTIDQFIVGNIGAVENEMDVERGHQ